MYFICYNFDLFSNVNIYPRENIWKLQHFKNNQDVENLTSDGIDHNVLKRKLQIDIVRKIWGFKILSLQSTYFSKRSSNHFCRHIPKHYEMLSKIGFQVSTNFPMLPIRYIHHFFLLQIRLCCLEHFISPMNGQILCKGYVICIHPRHIIREEITILKVSLANYVGNEKLR